jgi:hypothetical protein
MFDFMPCAVSMRIVQMSCCPPEQVFIPSKTSQICGRVGTTPFQAARALFDHDTGSFSGVRMIIMELSRKGVSVLGMKCFY